MRLDDWQRIEKIVRWAGLSVNSFALNIGLNRGENLYQIKRGNYGVSKELAELISTKYPEISKAWIITGEGDMFVSGSDERIAIPCYESDVAHLAAQDKLPQPAYMASVPRLRGAEFGALWLNRAMEPEIPHGALVFLREVEPEKAVPGYPYLVVCDSLTAVRKLRREPGGTRIRLIAANSDFDEINIDICEIKKLYAVKGHICYNQ